jgi:hypothetical protein
LIIRKQRGCYSEFAEIPRLSGVHGRDHPAIPIIDTRVVPNRLTLRLQKVMTCDIGLKIRWMKKLGRKWGYRIGIDMNGG